MWDPPIHFLAWAGCEKFNLNKFNLTTSITSF